MEKFRTIRQTSKELLNESALRKLCHEGRLPGIWVGRRFYVNVEMLREQLKTPERSVNVGK